eukprot:739725-Amphidinium_carterae.1
MMVWTDEQDGGRLEDDGLLIIFGTAGQIAEQNRLPQQAHPGPALSGWLINHTLSGRRWEERQNGSSNRNLLGRRL